MIWDEEKSDELDSEESNIEAMPGIVKVIRKIFFLLLALHFVFNFAVLPGLNIVYALEVAIVLFHLISRGWKESAVLIIALFFIEGQGRIIWSYHPFFRLLFDILLLIAFLRKAIRSKKIFPIELLPNYILLLIILHFFWYTVQLFNTDNVGFVGVLAAAKIYIVPFFIFFLFIMEPINHRFRLEKIQLLTIFMLIAQSALAIFQMANKEQVLLDLHPYYAHPLHGDQFTGSLFRPFGTGFNAGGFSIFYYLTVGFVFIMPGKKRINILRAIVVLSSMAALFISQVRSAMVKFFLIFLLSQLVIWISTHKRFKASVKYLSFIFVLLFLSAPYISTLDFVNLDLQTSLDRFSSLGDVESIKGSRISFDTFFKVLSDKLEQNPIGLGPGRTGAASTFSLGAIASDPIYGKNSSWAYDNLWISLAIDLGWGAIFYIALVTLFPFIFFFYALKNRNTLDALSFRIVMISSITLFVILLGNWGAVGLPYNPESFMYWLWVAVGWSEYNKGRRYDH
jgi:hypothetical protein